MAKGRHLKPGFFTDKNIVSMSPLARLLYQGLWCYAADCGHLDDEPVELKMRILPADSCDVDALLDEIAWHQRIERKDQVIFLPKLSEHVRVDKRYETKCEACKDAGHDVNTPSEAPPSTPNTKGSRRTHAVPTTGTRSDHDADGDGDGEVMVKGKATPRSRATALRDDFRPSDKHLALAADLGVDLRREWPKFGDYHRSKGSTMKDWNAALNNWIRKAAEYGGNVRPIRSAPDDQGRLVLPPLPKGVFDQ